MYIDYKNRIFGLDVIRAIAILLVLFSHSTLLLFPNDSNTVLTIIRFFGAIGVDVFFVLSGFLIGRILLKQLNNEKTEFKNLVYFWIRRWFKTLPNYFFVLILNVIVYYVFNEEVISGLYRFFFFVHNFNQPMPDFFTESWSLSIEEFAYVIVPVLLYFSIGVFNKISKNKMFIIVTLIVVLFVFTARIFHYFNHLIENYNDWSQQLRKVVIYRVDSIYYGFLAAYISFTYSKAWERFKNRAFLLGVIIFVGLHVTIFALYIQPQTAPLFYTVFYLPLLSINLLLFFPVFSCWKDGRLLMKLITFISLRSYALYLVNYSLVVFTIQHFVNIEDYSGLGKLIIILSYWILSFCLAHILYKYFEKPIMNLRDSPFIRERFLE